MKYLFLFLLTTLFPYALFSQETTSINFQNTERSDHPNPNDGLLTYDLNFYSDYPEYSTDGGGLSVYSGEDGWGAIFDTNNMKWLTPEFNGLTITGNLGIGTANPSSLLDAVSSNGNKTRLNYADTPSISFIPNNGNSHFHISHTLDNRLTISQGTSVGSNRLLSIVNNGNIGIGTTSPVDKLHINEGKIRVSGGSDRMYMNVDDANSKSVIGFGDDFGDRLDILFDYWNGSSSDLELMSLLSNGNVGIGTTSPDSKLAVNGVIHSKEVKVDLTGWPDYVFKESHNLPTLEEVKKHIKEKGHLINIPSAEEVEANGVELGEMNKLLLEKIEELTVYTLQQQEEINGYQKDIMLLTQKMEAMEQQINNLKN